MPVIRDGPRLAWDSLGGYVAVKPKRKTLTCGRCGKEHKPPRRGDSVRCACGEVLW